MRQASSRFGRRHAGHEPSRARQRPRLGRRRTAGVWRERGRRVDSCAGGLAIASYMARLPGGDVTGRQWHESARFSLSLSLKSGSIASQRSAGGPGLPRRAQSIASSPVRLYFWGRVHGGMAAWRHGSTGTGAALHACFSALHRSPRVSRVGCPALPCPTATTARCPRTAGPPR
ncbi:hypothetical protein BS50DRAFT_47763 [Corynespora cassiicola Philippines]|uniref:Uncharacterized protein n=1 Tax=Corynespora cassiicola Philippines TaxID=1448308 RepID=A0A2T2NHP0_CORCC|nr:hypothetical protein BS50DRAFT_47763 [Corynespora cassiicola Philippines]